MNVWKLLWNAVLVTIGIFVLSAVVLLVYYRPSIEYAYVDMLDRQARPAPGWLVVLVGLSFLLLVGAALAWLKKKANQRG